MAYEVEWKQRNYNDDLSKVVSTTVQISTRKPQRILTVTLDSDVTSKNDEELVSLALEQFYKETYLDRDEKEAIAKIKSEINAIKEEALKEIKEETEKNREMVRAITLIVNKYLMAHEEELEEEEDDDTGSSDDSEGSEEESRTEEERSDSNDN